MSDRSRISWTDASWDVVTGCTKTSQSCAGCYVEREWSRFAANPRTVYHGRKFTDVAVHPERLRRPLQWRRPRRIFVDARGDLFHESVPDDILDAVMGVAWCCLCTAGGQSSHVFQVLTKRPERMRAYLSQDRRRQWADAAVCYGGGNDPDALWDQVSQAEGPHPRIWWGVSIEDQPTANERIAQLLATPAAVRWVSAEPLLGPVDVTDLPNKFGMGEGQRHLNALGGYVWECDGPDYVDTCNIGARIDLCIAGGESGPRARPMHPVWARGLRDPCAHAGVPFQFKQWGEWAPESSDTDGLNVPRLLLCPDGTVASEPVDGAQPMVRVGKSRAGCLLDGQEHPFPEFQIP